MDAAAALTAELLAHPQVTVLATSREPLAIPGEIRWPVPALAVPPEGTTAVVEAPCHRRQRAAVHRTSLPCQPAIHADRRGRRGVARLCLRLEGIPLAIELAAARMGGLSAGQLAEELDERLPLATAAARGVPGLHTTMWACIDWSYRLLTTPEQAAFRCLAGFIEPFTADAFAAVTRATLPAGSGPPAETLYRLVGKSLVSAEPDTGHYRVLETIRAFCAEQARDAGELTAARDAHAGYYASWLAGLDANDAGDDVIDLIDADYPNVRAALTWSIEAGSPRAAAIAALLCQVWQERGHYHYAIVLGDCALRTAAAYYPPLWAKASRRWPTPCCCAATWSSCTR